MSHKTKTSRKNRVGGFRVKSPKLPGFLSHPALKHSHFSRLNLGIFIIIFAAIGGYILLSSHAATSIANIFVSANGSDTGVNCVRFASPISNPDPSGASLCASFDKAYKLAQSGDNVEVEAGNYPKQAIYGNSPKSITDGSCSITPTAQSTQGCITFSPAVNTAPAIAGLTIMAPGVRVMNLDFKDGGVGVAWLDNPFGVSCKNVPQPHDVILDSIHAYISSQPAPGTATGSLSASGVYNVAIVNSDIGPFYDGPGTGQFSNLTQAASSYCAAYPVEQLKDKNIYLYNNKWHDLHQTVVSNGANCLNDPAQYFCNHMECIHWRASNSWIINNKFLDCAQNDVSVQTFGSNVPNIDNLQIIGNVFDVPCSNQPAPCGVISALPIICSTIGDSITNTIVAYNSIKGNAGFQADSCTSSTTFAGSVVVGNLMQAPASTFSCSTKTSIGVAFAYNIWDPSSTAVCDPTDHILSGNIPWTNPAPPTYDFSLSSGSEIANFVPKTVSIAGKNVTCPARDIANNIRPTSGNLCAAGAYEFVPTANVWVSPTGSDSTCTRGDSSKPCATFNQAYQIAQSGDLVQVGCGGAANYTYPAQTILQSSPAKTGPDNITFKPANGCVVHLGQTTGVDSNGFPYAQLLVRASYVTLDGNINGGYCNDNIANCGFVMNGNVDRVAVNFHYNSCGGSCVMITNDTISGVSASQFEQGSSINTTFTHNDFGPVSESDSTTGCIGGSRWAADKYQSQNTVFSYNNVHDSVVSGTCHTVGMTMGCVNGTSIDHNKFWGNTQNDIENIYFEGWCGGSSCGYGAFSYDNVKIEDNFFGQPTGGPSFPVISIGPSDTHNCSGTIIPPQGNPFHNWTIRNNSTNDPLGMVYFRGCNSANSVCPTFDQSGVTITGNILGAYGLPVAMPCTTLGLHLSYNVVNSGNSTCDATDTTAPAFQYVNSASTPPDLHLMTGAAAIDKGNPLNCPSTDIDNDTRPQGSVCDAGADEFVLGASTKPGDLNSDGKVNLQDLSILLTHYGQSATSSQGDINGDGRVTLLDLSILLSAYGT